MKLLKNLFALGLLSACTLTAAQWQWLDKEGHKVFSDRAPPSDIVEKNILKRPGNQPLRTSQAAETTGAPTATTTSNTTVPPKDTRGSKITGIDDALEAKKKQTADAQMAKKQAEEERIAKLKIENCALGKQAKATMDSGVRVSRVNAAGEREVMDEAARATESKRIQAVMATNCS